MWSFLKAHPSWRKRDYNGVKEKKKDAVAFLKKAGTYYLATDDHGQPRVRPFGTAHIYEGSVTSRQEKRKPYPDSCMRIRSWKSAHYRKVCG